MPCSISDHYLVGIFNLPDNTYGPKQWRFPVDLLGHEQMQWLVHSIGDNFDFNNAVDSWELSKVKI